MDVARCIGITSIVAGRVLAEGDVSFGHERCATTTRPGGTERPVPRPMAVCTTGCCCVITASVAEAAAAENEPGDGCDDAEND